MYHLFLVLMIILAPAALGNDIEVRFHPYDNNLGKIARSFDKAQHTIDMALYNIDASKSNPVIAWILKEDIQQRIQSGELQVRLLFEGFESPESLNKKMAFFEELGVDVKTLGKSQKMHHKFAVVDGYTMDPILITGSANWSMMSQRQFNENTLYFNNHMELSQNYQKQFELLWKLADEVGHYKNYPEKVFLQVYNPRPGIRAYFNTDNFKLTEKGFQKKPSKQGFVLTRQLVKTIDQAESDIEIATTRIKLRPIYNAILRAAERGVKVNIVVTMESYQYEYRRKKALMRDCDNEYLKSCSTSQDFALLLERNEYPGKHNVEVRIKYFHIKKDAYLTKQMHSKYMIVDGKHLLTGSFNWSYSAEYNHIENLLFIDQYAYPETILEFQGDFQYLWNLGRASYQQNIQKFENAVKKKQKVACGFAPMTLTYAEIDYLLNSGQRAGGSLTNACE